MTASAYKVIRLLYCIRFAYGLGISSVTLSKNPVYNGEPVTLTCDLTADSLILLSVTIDSVDETQKVGTLYCNPTTGITFQNTGVGRFSGYNFAGCSSFDAQNPSLSVSIVASPSWELDYRCTFEVYDSTAQDARNVTSPFSHLSVIGKPDIPKIFPSPLVFNETGSAVVICESRHGNPRAVIALTVRAPDGNHIAAMGTESVSLNLSVSLRWRNATVLCNVTNHNASGITAVSPVIINYIAARSDTPFVVNTYSSSQVLDCSADISSFPTPSYKWWIPSDANIAESSSMNTPFLTIPQGRSGFFVCVAVNNITSKIALATYNVTNVLLSSAHLNWLILALCLLIVGIVITVAVLHKRGHFLRRKSSASQMRNEPQESLNRTISLEQEEGPRVRLLVQESQYQSLNLQAMNEQTYARIPVRPLVNDSTT